MDKHKCSDCRWWDRKTNFDGTGHFRQCSNPNAPGYRLWREGKSTLCKDYFEPKEECRDEQKTVAAKTGI